MFVGWASPSGNCSSSRPEHHNYQEVYYINSEIGDVKLQIFYDRDGFVTQVGAVAYTEPQIVEVIHIALGL